MALDINGGSRDSPPPVRSRHVLKKGPWTAEEDLLLLEYVKKHGEGNWNAVQRNSGLMRCGKSCRLRWANHLRPNLKKGAFSPEEEQLIVELHAKLGNKWACMAAQIPGRTDNEIKNYWNTRLKRRRRAGLAIYPHERVDQEQRRRRRHQQPQCSSSQTHSLSSLLLHPNPFTFDPPMIGPGDDNGGVAPSSYLFDHGGGNQLPINQYSSLDYGVRAGAGMEDFELPSIQSPPWAAADVTPAASCDEFVVEDFEVEGGDKSGLLEDLFAAGGHFHGGSNSHDSYEGTEEGMASMEDELMNLLDNFPLSVPIPDWNGGDERESPICNNGTSSAMRSQLVASEYNPVAATSGAANQDWNSGCCLWNNMPTIY